MPHSALAIRARRVWWRERTGRPPRFDTRSERSAATPRDYCRRLQRQLAQARCSRRSEPTADSASPLPLSALAPRSKAAAARSGLRDAMNRRRGSRPVASAAARRSHCAAPPPLAPPRVARSSHTCDLMVQCGFGWKEIGVDENRKNSGLPLLFRGTKVLSQL